MKKVIARIKGGIGNQLFIYAAARRLAAVNDAELVLDHVTGFTRDFRYCRKYALDRFNVAGRKATAAEQLEPLQRIRRGILKRMSKRKPFSSRRYIEQEGLDFDERLLSLKVSRTLFFEGYWQSEGYFKDIETQIRNELKVTPPSDDQNLKLAERIRDSCSVAIHVRWFAAPESNGTSNAPTQYYRRALSVIASKITSPHYFLFSDDPDAAVQKLELSADQVTCVGHNRGDEGALADFWLMQQCKHFITANSTFSWWTAWLCDRSDKIVVTPKTQCTGEAAWGFRGLLPEQWIKL
jgi:hypothetical protein